LADGRVGEPQISYYNNKNTDSTWAYDAAGNLIDDGSSPGGHIYSYDAENRLIQIDSSSTQYAYDAGGRRVKRTANSVTTYYLYGLTGLMSEFSTASGASGAQSTDRLQYRLGEQTGTAVMLISADGNPRENNRVFPFGEPWLSFAASNNSEKFTTYLRDDANGEAGLDYAMARYYASRSGRFMTADPGHVGANVGDPQSWNAYVYALNDPINFIDPDGLCSFKQDGKEVTYPDGSDKCPKGTSVTVTTSGPPTETPGYSAWYWNLVTYWDTFNREFLSREAMDDLKQRFLGGMVNYFDDHRRDTRGLSPFPTSKEDLGLQLATGPFAVAAKARAVATVAKGALPAARYAAKGFAKGQLEKHFAKHAAEWGAGNITKTAYLKRAQDLLGRDVGGDILGHVRANGDVLRYNARTNEFAVGAADGTIRTLFRPSGGMKYWLDEIAP
jgi:RHS repeat-associated protein